MDYAVSSRKAKDFFDDANAILKERVDKERALKPLLTCIQICPDTISGMDLKAKARLLIARIFDAEENKEEAIKWYKAVIADYENCLPGLIFPNSETSPDDLRNVVLLVTYFRLCLLLLDTHTNPNVLHPAIEYFCRALAIPCKSLQGCNLNDI